MLDVKHSLKIGDILVSTWGYDQTNISFYKVIKLKGKTMVELVEVESDITEMTDCMSYNVKPSNRTVRDTFTRKVCLKTNCVYGRWRVDIADLWNGKPLQETKYH